ncbi:MAG: choice-of-anchor J domain-containing protein [Chitinophagaceae bacterium]
MRKIYFLLLLLFTCGGLFAQPTNIARYLTSTSNETYTAISGGTVVASGTYDNQVSAAVNLGGTFTYGGTAFTTCYISANGYITFGAAPAGTNYTPLSTLGSTTGAISAFGQDAGGSQVAGATPEVSYLNVGGATGEFVAQWKDHANYYNRTQERLNFQIRLNLATGVIKIVYGPCTNPGTVSTANGINVQVGIRGNSVAYATNVNNLMIGNVPAGTTCNWSNAVTGSSNASTMLFSSVNTNVNIPNGLTYTWVPLTAVAPVRAFAAVSGITTTGATISWTAPTGATRYNVQYRVPGTCTWTNFSGNPVTGTTATLTGLLPSTSYQVRVQAADATNATIYSHIPNSSGAGDGYTTSGTFSTLCDAVGVPYSQNFESVTAPSIPTCTAVFDVNGGTTWDTWPTPDPAWGFTGNVLRYLYNTTLPGNDWYFLRGLNLTGGTTYQITFKYGATDPLYPEKLKVAFGTSATPAAMTTTIVDYPNIVAPAVAPFANLVTLPFTPATTGVYYIGFQAYSAADQFRILVDDILVDVQPACTAPTALTASAPTPTTATLGWTASSTSPSGGYQWEIRTSGAGGSGATGLTTSGSVAAGVVTANATGLAANTSYNLYVRSNCGSGNFSTWAGPFAFTTPCTAITTFPFTETFEAASATRPCWTRQVVSGAFNWTYGAGAGNGGVTSAHGGTVNAQFFGNTYNGDQARLISPQLDLSGMTNGADLEFWYVNPSWLGDINELRVYYKTSAAGSWTLIPGAVYTTAVGAWTKVELNLLPNINSTYYIAFEGTQYYGYGIGVDDVVVKAAPTCRKPTNVTALGISPTSAMVSFTSPGNSFIVEYGAPGFTPGTANTAGTGGTLVFGAASPIAIPSGLSASTTYDVYIRRICTPGVDYSENVKVSLTTLCAATNIPYVQNFESAVIPEAPTCMSLQDVNGNSGPEPNATGGRWTTFVGANNQTYVSPTKVIRYLYDAADLARGADDWLYTQGLNLTGGSSYRVKFYFKASDGPTWTEKMEVKFGTAAHNSAMTNTIYSNMNIATALASPWDSVVVDFTPPTTGVYYVGIHAMSDPDQAFLYVDDLSVKAAPLVDVGVTGVTGNPTCPGSAVLRATIRNYNLTTLNFATYPVTVTATMSGASTGSVNTTINTGTLAPGASTTVNLPAFTFVGGSYSINTKTASASDPETGNDAITVSAYVNPTPVAATITPAAPAICAGASVQLSTQFVTPPPAPVTMPAVSSGAITVAIPDNAPAGGNHSLTVSGIPANATVTGVSVTVNVAHNWIADVIVNLKAPNGKVLNLINQHGGLLEANLTNTVISSASTTPMPGTGAPFTGTYAADAAGGVGPTGFISDASGFAELFQGPGNGTWTIAARDNEALIGGTLTSWSITVTYAVVYPKVTWTPVTGLFTDAALTNPYIAGTDLASVYAKPAATATYTATTTSAAGCTSTGTVTVTVNPNPVVTIGALPNKICLSDTLVALTATPAGGTWSGIGVSGNNFVPPVTAVGTYTLSYSSTNTFGCTTVGTTQAKVEDCPERIILLRDNAVILFPNPNNGQFNIRINSTLYNRLTMRVYTGNGALVRTQQFSGLVFGRVVPIDLRSMPSGSYMVQFSYENAGVRTSEKAFKVIIGR